MKRIAVLAIAITVVGYLIRLVNDLADDLDRLSKGVHP